MPYTTDEGPAIYYEVEGEAGDPPVVLIEGLGAQMVGWRDGFRRRLLSLGRRVVRLDNRDVGLSGQCGEPGDDALAYTIRDMAGDICRVIDACGDRSAHIVGQSMGGAVAQSLAIHHPDRVRSLTLFYTAPVFDGAHIGAAAQDRPPPPPEGTPRETAIEMRVEAERACGSPLYGFDEAWAREAAALSWDRCPRTDGALRQRAALAATADHRDDLHRIAVPTAIIHGRDDGIVLVSGGEALARLLPHADLHLFAGLGHVVAEPLWPQFTAIIDHVVTRGEAAFAPKPGR